MSALLTSLPGDIQGLLCRGSPCRIHRWSDYVAVAAPESGSIRLASAWGTRIDAYGLEIVALDLTDPTGRAHAAWWLTGRLDPARGDEVWRMICRATTGIDMTPTQIDTLARLALRLAGRE